MNFTLSEAQLFRMLSSFFGEERVVAKLSVKVICGGTLPVDSPELLEWASSNRCLFTIVDFTDTPKLVVEFFSGFEESIDPAEEEHQRILPELLAKVGVQYITVSESEFDDILCPGSGYDLTTFLQEKVDQNFFSRSY